MERVCSYNPGAHTGVLSELSQEMYNSYSAHGITTTITVTRSSPIPSNYFPPLLF